MSLPWRCCKGPSPKLQGRIGGGYDGRDGIRPDVALSLPRLSHHTLVLINFPYDRIEPVPGIFPLPLRQPRDLSNIFPLPQQGIYPPFHLHGRLFMLPLDILVFSLCARFEALGLVDGGGNLGPNFFPCLFQSAVFRMTEVPLIPLPNMLNILHCTLSDKPQLPHPLYIYISSKNIASPCLLISWRPVGPFRNDNSSIS